MPILHARDCPLWTCAGIKFLGTSRKVRDFRAKSSMKSQKAVENIKNKEKMSDSLEIIKSLLIIYIAKRFCYVINPLFTKPEVKMTGY